MSVTCGFFNAVNHDRRYDARQMSSIFDGIINDGVFMNIGSGMAIKANPEEEDLKNMYVYIEPGRCWFNSAWTLNDAIEPILIEDSELVLDRIDTVVLEVNHSDPVRECRFIIVKGTPATNPVPAEMEDSEYVHQHAFARVYVKSGATQINQEDITNCVGTSETPYVTGILETINADDLLAQWQDQFTRWMNNNYEDFDTWYANTRVLFDEWLADVTDALSSASVLAQVKSVLYTDVVEELKAGDTIVTFQNIMIDSTKDYIIHFYPTKYGIMPVDYPVYNDTDHTMKVRYNAQDEDIKIILRIENQEVK